jgi:hypothetical protein
MGCKVQMHRHGIAEIRFPATISQNMSDQPLSYQTPPLEGASKARTTAWISLLVLGILYVIGGLCLGLSSIFAVSMIGAAGRGGGPGGAAGAIPGNAKTILIAVLGTMLLLIVAVSAIYLICAFRVRKGSRAAGITAMVVSALNALLLIAIVCLGVIGIVSGANGRGDMSGLVGIIFYLVPIAANTWVAIAIGWWLRERRTPASSNSAIY